MPNNTRLRNAIERVKREARRRQQSAENKRSKKEAKKELFKQLTDDELVILYRWIQAEINTTWRDISKEKVRNHFENFSGKKLIRIMSVFFIKISGRREWKGLYQEILNSLPEFKKKLAQSSYARVNDLVATKSKISSSCHGDDLTAQNTYTGQVAISKHALERFCERVCNTDLLRVGDTKKKNTKHMLEVFRKSFARARPVEINPVKRTNRLIEHGFIPATYLLDTAVNIRFVVPEQKRGKQLIITTVERPYYK